jgi:hypothetical protein
MHHVLFEPIFHVKYGIGNNVVHTLAREALFFTKEGQSSKALFILMFDY